MKTVTILGAGNMGTALAIVAAKKSTVKMWSIEKDVILEINEKHTNQKYLRDIVFPKNISATNSLKDAIKGAALIIVAVPSHVVPSLAHTLEPLLKKTQFIVNAAKGVEEKTLRTQAEVLAGHLSKTMKKNIATLSGPSIANEFAAGKYCAVTLAAPTMKTATTIAKFLETNTFRTELSTDIRGTALGGTLKNMYALLLGMADGLQLGMNAKSALLAAALKEIALMMKALGAKSESAYALSGIGDLVVTGMSNHSRNRSFGEELCIDPDCRIKMKDPTQTIEGVRAVQTIAPIARKKKMNTPLLFGVESVLFKNETPEDAVKKIFSKM